MYKKGVFLLIACLVFSFLRLPTGVSAKGTGESSNLIVNGSFAQTTQNNRWTNNTGPANWGNWTPEGSGKLTVDPDVYHEGKQSILLEASTTSRVDVFQNVSVSTGTTYELSFWTKTENVKASWGGVYVRTQLFNSSGKKVAMGPKTDKLKGTHDWTLEKLRIPIPKEASQLRIELFLETATGKVWFDNVRLVKTNEVLTNFSLEENAITLGKGETDALTPIFTPSDAPDKTVFWTSSKPDRASVDSNGVVTGKDYGTVTITAKTKDGGYTDHCLVSVEPASYQKYYNELRARWFNKLTGNTQYDPNDPDAAARIAAIDNSVTNSDKTGYLDTMNQSQDRTYLWSDLKSTTNSADITSGYRRLRDMARAFVMKGSKLYHKKDLKAAIISGMDWMYEHRYNVNGKEYGNWWDWEIGAPKALNNVVVLMYDQLSPMEIQHFMNAVDHFVPDPTGSVGLNREAVGANRMDKALVVGLRGVIGKNGVKITQARNALSQVFQYVKNGNGFYKDGSFIQHNNIAYTGSYGAVLIGDMADMFYLLKNSPWKVTDPNAENVYHWVADSFEPLIYKGAMMDMVSGRAISREGSSDHVSGRGTVINLLELAQGAPPEEALRIKRMVKYWIQQDTTFDDYAQDLPIYDINLVHSLMNDAAIKPRGTLTMNHVFSSMDRVVHRRPGFAYGISMFSDRISAFEYGNGENKKGWYTGLGMTYLYNNDLHQYGDDFWPTVNMLRLPGTTTDHSIGTLKGWHGYLNTKNWVGGSTVDGLYGAAGMAFSLQNVTGSPLHGKKSWFMFDDEIVALGAGITDTDNRKVETIVENRKLDKAGDNTLIVNGKQEPSQPGWAETMNHVKWAHLEGNVPHSGIGYYFPGTAGLSGLREARTGSWKEINDGGSPDLVKRNYLSLAFEHGVNPKNASYAYVLLPNKNVAATKQYSNDPDIQILSNTSNIQVVHEKTLGITAANFFKPGKVSFIKADNPASITVRKEGGVLTLAVSDPTQKQNTVTIELDKPELTVASKDSSIQVVQTSPAIKVKVDVSGSLGRTQVIRFAIDIDHLDETVDFGWNKSWIMNKGIYNSLMAKVARIQEEQNNNGKERNGLTALENEVQAQSGKHIDPKFAKLLLDDIRYLKKQTTP